MRTTRALLGLTGLLVLAVGLMKLWDRGPDGVVAAAKWLVAGVILHDGVLAPLVVLAGFLVVRRLPAWSRTPVVAGFVVLGSATLMAIPVLGRFGARPDNPTLLDRNYTAGWLVLAALVAVAVAVGCWWNARHQSGSGRTVDDMSRGEPEQPTPLPVSTARKDS